MHIFLKTVKIASASKAPPPNPRLPPEAVPAMLLPPTITNVSSSFLALKLPSKMNKIIAVNVLLLLLPQIYIYFSFQIL